MMVMISFVLLFPLSHAAAAGTGIQTEIIGQAQEEGIGSQRDLVWIGDYIYAAAAQTKDRGGLTIWDVSDPAAPAMLAEEGTGLVFARGVAVRDGIAYVSGRNSGSLAAIDVSTPAEPVSLSVLQDETLLGARGVALIENYAIVACGLHPSTDEGTQGVALIDISDPRQLKLVARLDEKTDARIVSGGSVLVDAQRRLVFISMYRHDGAMVFDFSEDGGISLRSTFHSPDIQSARGLTMREQILFVSGADSNNLVALDTADPDALTQVGMVRHRGLRGARGSALVAGDQYLVVSSRSSGTSALVDIRNPAQMQVLSTAGDHRGLYGACSRGDDFAHVSASTGALLIGRVIPSHEQNGDPK